MTLRGQVKNGVVVFQSGAALPDGTLVVVTPLAGARGSPAAIIAAMENAPRVPTEWVDELERLIAQGKRPPTTTDPFADETPGRVSQERREALLGLIGIWKMENPPDDEEVERIIEEERMKKYG